MIMDATTTTTGFNITTDTFEMSAPLENTTMMTIPQNTPHTPSNTAHHTSSSSSTQSGGRSFSTSDSEQGRGSTTPPTQTCSPNHSSSSTEPGEHLVQKDNVTMYDLYGTNNALEQLAEIALGQVLDIETANILLQLHITEPGDHPATPPKSDDSIKTVTDTAPKTKTQIKSEREAASWKFNQVIVLEGGRTRSKRKGPSNNEGKSTPTEEPIPAPKRQRKVAEKKPTSTAKPRAQPRQKSKAKAKTTTISAAVQDKWPAVAAAQQLTASSTQPTTIGQTEPKAIIADQSEQYDPDTTEGKIPRQSSSSNATQAAAQGSSSSATKNVAVSATGPSTTQNPSAPVQTHRQLHPSHPDYQWDNPENSPRYNLGYESENHAIIPEVGSLKIGIEERGNEKTSILISLAELDAQVWTGGAEPVRWDNEEETRFVEAFLGVGFRQMWFRMARVMPGRTPAELQAYFYNREEYFQDMHDKEAERRKKRELAEKRKARKLERDEQMKAERAAMLEEMARLAQIPEVPVPEPMESATTNAGRRCSRREKKPMTKALQVDEPAKPPTVKPPPKPKAEKAMQKEQMKDEDGVDLPAEFLYWRSAIRNVKDRARRRREDGSSEPE